MSEQDKEKQIEQTQEEFDVIVPEKEEKEIIKENPSNGTSEDSIREGELPTDSEEHSKPEEMGEGKEDGGETGEEVDATDSNTPEEPTEETKEVVEEKEETPTENVEEIKENSVENVEELQRKIEELEYERETVNLKDEFQNILRKQQSEFAEFNKALRQEVVNQLDKYGIPTDIDIEELKSTDPAKFQIFNNIVTNAEKVAQEVTAEIQKPIQEAANNIVFRIAGKEMEKYGLTQEQAVEAANTFVDIIHTVGIQDLSDDLKAKVELAVGRAKMLHEDVKTIKQDVLDVADGVKKTVEDTKKTVEDVKETIEEVKTIKKDVKEFTEGATVGNTSKTNDVNLENVMELYYAIKDDAKRLDFFAKYKDMIMSKIGKNGGMKYA